MSLFQWLGSTNAQEPTSGDSVELCWLSTNTLLLTNMDELVVLNEH